MEFSKEERKMALKILNKHVPNRFNLFNDYINAMQEYAKWYSENKNKE